MITRPRSSSASCVARLALLMLLLSLLLLLLLRCPIDSGLLFSSRIDSDQLNCSLARDRLAARRKNRNSAPKTCSISSSLSRSRLYLSHFQLSGSPENGNRSVCASWSAPTNEHAFIRTEPFRCSCRRRSRRSRCRCSWRRCLCVCDNNPAAGELALPISQSVSQPGS